MVRAMNILTLLAQYIYDNIGISISPIHWNEADLLPIYLHNAYDFSAVELLHRSCLLAIDKSRSEPSPAIVRKHMDQLHLRFEGDVVYVRFTLSPHNRKRLILHKVPFIVPGNQMYLPMLGIELREYFKNARSTPEKLSRAAQVSLLHILLHDTTALYRPKDLAEVLGYSTMTMTRVFDELAKLGEVRKEGRERRLRFTGDKKTVWEAARPHLTNPVKKRIYVASVKQLMPAAGLSALARQSSLAEPAVPVYAVDGGASSILGSLPPGDPYDPDTIELELWHYDPVRFAQNGMVDPFSLYLSLQDSQDSRIEAALEEMMGNLKW